MNTSASNPTEAPYVLLTPVRNEAVYIRATILSILSQTKRSFRWIVANDGLTDGTDQIISNFPGTHSFIELLTFDQEPERTFASRA